MDYCLFRAVKGAGLGAFGGGGVCGVYTGPVNGLGGVLVCGYLALFLEGGGEGEIGG